MQKVLIMRHWEAWLALFPLQGKRGERQKRAQQTEKKKKKKIHTRPVMQKHRFNVRLGSGVSSGERKKLVRTNRKRETEIRGGEEAESHPAASGVPVITLMEHSEKLLKGFSPGEITGPGPPRWSLWERLHREDGTPIEATTAPSLDKQSHNVLN